MQKPERIAEISTNVTGDYFLCPLGKFQTHQSTILLGGQKWHHFWATLYSICLAQLVSAKKKRWPQSGRTEVILLFFCNGTVCHLLCVTLRSTFKRKLATHLVGQCKLWQLSWNDTIRCCCGIFFILASSITVWTHLLIYLNQVCHRLNSVQTSSSNLITF